MSIPQSGGGPIENFDQLAELLASGNKPKADWRIGTEHEKFGWLTDSRKPLPYAGTGRSRRCSTGCRHFGWTPLHEGDNIIGMTRNGANISLEPGGQFELSGAAAGRSCTRRPPNCRPIWTRCADCRPAGHPVHGDRGGARMVGTRICR